jgi:hypothetical protein
MNQAATNAFVHETAHILEHRCDRETRSASQRKSIDRALLDYRRQSALDVVRQSWVNGGQGAGLLSFLAAVAKAPDLLSHRPALGLFRRIIFGKAITDLKSPSG